MLNKTDHESFRVLLPVVCLIVLCALPEICLTLSDFGIIDLPRLRALTYEYGGFWPGLLKDWAPNYPGQSWLMFLSYGFLHSGPIHLIVNMITLWSLGRVVLDRVSAWHFLLLYIGSLLGGALGFGILSETLNPMVGASGALFGLIGGVLAWEYVDRFTYKEGLWPVVYAVLALIALNLVLWWAMDGHMAWQTHLSGFVAGWILALLIDPKGREAI